MSVSAGRLAALAFALAATGCQSDSLPTYPADTAAGTPLALRVGETARRDGHAVGFVRVIDDSRCPVGAQCIWAGEAWVEVTLDGHADTLVVARGGAPLAPGVSQLEHGGMVAEVVGLDPYPGSFEAWLGMPATLRAVTRGASGP